MGTYYVILTCRNSEDTIQEAVMSLMHQTVRANFIIVVDDGSTDNTSTILESISAEWKGLHVISNPDLGYDISRVVNNWNKAIELAARLGQTDYHMISADDNVYDKDYAEKILAYMDADPKIALASGNIDDNLYVTPRGGGRFVRNSFFQIVHGRYPEKIGYESAILYTASLNNYSYKVFNEVRFKHTRKLGQNHHFYEFGAAMRTLGYHPLLVLGRFLKYLTSGKPIGRLGSIYMLYYYLSYKPKNDGYDSMYGTDLRQFIRRTQLNFIRSKVKLKCKSI
jgi:glycosyltransferase involved in cell wall biosynthesis